MRKTLLLGAGFSCDLGMPLASELTEDFLGIFDVSTLQWLGQEMPKQKPFSSDRPINANAIEAGLRLITQCKDGTNANYEKLLADFEITNGIQNPNQSDRDTYHYISSILYGIIDTILRSYQIFSYETVYEKNKKWFCNFKNLLSASPTWVFNLNHDLCVEYLALDYGIPITCGGSKGIEFPIDNLNLKQRIEFSVLDRNDLAIGNAGYLNEGTGINLVRLHGGVTELEYEDRSRICNLLLNGSNSKDLVDKFNLFNKMGFYARGERISGSKDMTITNPDGTLDIIQRSMLTGGNKYAGLFEPQKYEEKIKLLDDALKQSDELTIIGYGHGDEHINLRILNAMVLNERLRVVLIDPYSIRIPPYLKQFNYKSRVKNAMCNAAEWMDYCVGNKWNYEQSNGLKENQKYRKEVRQQVQKKLIDIFGIKSKKN